MKARWVTFQNSESLKYAAAEEWNFGRQISFEGLLLMAMEKGSKILTGMEEIKDGKYTRDGFIRSFMRPFISRFIISCRLKEPCSLNFCLKYFGPLFKEGTLGPWCLQWWGRDARNYLDTSFYAVNWTSRRNYIIILLKGQMRSNNLTSSMKQSTTRYVTLYL